MSSSSRNLDQSKRVTADMTYHAHRVGPDGRIVQTHCIAAEDDEDAIYLAETIRGNLRVDLWQGPRLVRIIEP